MACEQVFLVRRVMAADGGFQLVRARIAHGPRSGSAAEAERAACQACGTWARPHERMPVEECDLHFGGRTTRLIGRKRLECVNTDCEAKT